MIRKNKAKDREERVDGASVDGGRPRARVRRAKRAPAPPRPCAVCGLQYDAATHISYQDYPTEQRELLARFVIGRHPGIDLSGNFCRTCLEAEERELQSKQLIRHDGELYFVDLTLADHPILPTPLRMHALDSYTGRGVTIAFIDSGFYPHPDLILPHNRIVAMYDAVKGRAVRSIRSIATGEPPVEAWHGTMTACAAAGSGYLSDGHYRGIACDARLVLIRAMTEEYRIQTPQVVRALKWIRRNHERYGIRIVNLSLGVDETSSALDHPVIALVEELVSLGIVVVAASGNDPSRPLKPPGSAPSAITAGGYNDNNSTHWMRRELWHSSYGSIANGERKPNLLAPAIWIAAPILPRTAVKREAEALFAMAGAGEEELARTIERHADATAIAAKLRSAQTPLHARSMILRRIMEEKQITTSYKHVDGTSFAAPIVSSIVAQMLEARPDLLPAEVREILEATAALLPDAPAEAQGHGIVQANFAMEVLAAVTPAKQSDPVLRDILDPRLPLLDHLS